MKNNLLTLLIAFVLNVQAGPSIWSLEQSPTAEVFNGISAADNYFAIGVGENGSIVHFVNGDTGTLMNSGTSNDLYDVYAASNQLAVVTGEDTVLLWDGSVWQALITGNTNTLYIGAWITPEKDFVYYQSLGSTFNVICPYEIGAVQQGFCRAHNSPMLTMCGESDDIKLIMENGDILHYNNQLGEYNGNTGLLHDQINPLNLTGVYVPEDSCLPGPLKPLEIYAINNTNEFYHFDGDQWNNMGVSIPNEHILTWLNGSGGNNIVATGFKPNGMSGNDGVLWTYDGSVWTEDTNLPLGTPGLTDVAVNIGLVDKIFANGFDASNRDFTNSDVKVDILAAAEEGKFLHTGTLFPASLSDLSISKILVTPEPIRQGDRIIFQLVIYNSGPSDAIDFRFIDGYLNNIQIAVDNCGMTQFNQLVGWSYRDVRIPSLAAGGIHICTIEFDVVGPVGNEIRNYGALSDVDDINYENNRSAVIGVMIQALN